MTNHWIDLQHSDCILIQGSNAAENHPISFKWVLKAKDKGAEVIHVDPRFTRTSARSSMYAPLRSGTDIAFLGGILLVWADVLARCVLSGGQELPVGVVTALLGGPFFAFLVRRR